MVANCQVYKPFFPALCYQENLLKVYSVIQIINDNIKQDMGLPWGNHYLMPSN